MSQWLGVILLAALGAVLLAGAVTLLSGWWRSLNVGTKSILVGAHCAVIHPWFVAAAWWRLYRFRRVTCRSSGVRTGLLDWRLWLAFAVHDLGYWGLRNMDGEQGELHPRSGARLMLRFADPWCRLRETGEVTPAAERACQYGRRWHDFALYHSRFLSKRDGRQPSLLCAADKLAVALEPWWLYLPRVILSGEIGEYMEASRAAALGRSHLPGSKYNGEPIRTTAEEVAHLSPRRAWHRVMSSYCRAWAFEHADGRRDDWTPTNGARPA